MNIKRLIVVALVVLSGCAAPPPSQIEASNADYGPYPTLYKNIIIVHMSGVLKDPQSALYGFDKAPVKSWFGYYGKTYGWATCAGINAKNSYGGYTGSQPSFFMINNGRVVVAEHGKGAASSDTRYVLKLCARLI